MHDTSTTCSCGEVGCRSTECDSCAAPTPMLMPRPYGTHAIVSSLEHARSVIACAVSRASTLTVHRGYHSYFRTMQCPYCSSLVAGGRGRGANRCRCMCTALRRWCVAERHHTSALFWFSISSAVFRRRTCFHWNSAAFYHSAPIGY